MSSKNFLPLKEQIDKLNNEKNILVKGKVSREFLVRYGYFNLVNGYKEYFCKKENGSRKYYTDIKIDQFKDVMNFDKNLRKIIFRYVTQIEEEVGSIFGYIFEQTLTTLNKNWGDMSLYKYGNNNSGREILSRIYNDISKKENEYLKHYEKKHSYLPSWIMIKAISFGNLIRLISHTDNKFKKELCDLYSIDYDDSDFRKLTSMLSLINALRNHIAHSERIIDFRGRNQNKRTLTKYHKEFGYVKLEREKLVDSLLYMKMFIPGKEYKHLVNEIVNEFDILKNKIHNNAFIKICNTFGLDTSKNYKVSLKEISSNSHIINYSKYI